MIALVACGRCQRPSAVHVKPLKASNHWHRFRQMETIRHFIIHPKLVDKIQTSPNARVMWKLLTDSSFHDYAGDVKLIMMHYDADGVFALRWLFKCPLR
jgi:hypothetical protein